MKFRINHVEVAIVVGMYIALAACEGLPVDRYDDTADLEQPIATCVTVPTPNSIQVLDTGNGFCQGGNAAVGTGPYSLEVDNVVSEPNLFAGVSYNDTLGSCTGLFHPFYHITGKLYFNNGTCWVVVADQVQHDNTIDENGNCVAPSSIAWSLATPGKYIIAGNAWLSNISGTSQRKLTDTLTWGNCPR